MSLSRTSIDRTTLPAALLPLAKQQMRVTFTDDDSLITFKLQHAIDLFERLTGYAVYRASWTWAPGTDEWIKPETAPADLTGSSWAPVPVMRTTAFAVKDSSNVDVSASFAVSGLGSVDSIAPQYAYPKVTGATAAPIFTLTAGFVDQATIAPSIVDIIIRIAAWLYEYREVQNVPGIDNVPYANSLITTWWAPRC
jgi:hypothetical protein